MSRKNIRIVLTGILLACFFALEIDLAIGQVKGLNGQEVSFENLLEQMRDQGSQDVRPSNNAATLSLKELLDGVLSSHANLFDLELSVEVIDDIRKTSLLKPTSAIREHKLHHMFHFAQKGNKTYVSRCAEILPESELKDGNVKWDEDGRLTYVFDGKDSRTYTTAAKSGLIRSGFDRNTTRYPIRYLETTGIPASDDERKSPRYFAAYFHKGVGARVLPALEEVDGHLCHVIANIGAACWIDVESGFAVRRRIALAYDNAEGNKAIALRYLVCSKDFEQLNSHIWWPRLTQSIVYTLSGFPIEEHGQVSSITNYIVHKVNVSNIDDELFAYQFPEGTMVMDENKHTAYYMPGGIGELEEAISKGTQIVDGAVLTRPGRVDPKSRYSTLMQVFFVMNVLVILVLVFAVWNKRKTKIR